MYSETDIEAAVASGALTTEAAAALRASVASHRDSALVDEESFRLLTGFNDIFVSIAAILLLVAVGWIASSIGRALVPIPRFSEPDPRYLSVFARALGAATATAGIAVAAASWALAEYFTRRRRMALPSILLLATFALAVSAGIGGLLMLIVANPSPASRSLMTAIAALSTAAATYLHWRRFHVPITIAALTGALVATVVSLVLAVVPGARDAWLLVLLLSGIGVFGFAMWWDMSDRTRTTRRSDVAFWLHLAAAPMIAHPIFNLMGVLHDTIGVGTALTVILLYLLFGLVALAADRRALLVSGLIYVLYAIAGLFRTFGAVGLNVALTALVIGSALLLLSAFWHVARRRVVERLPTGLQSRLPALDRPAPVSR